MNSCTDIICDNTLIFQGNIVHCHEFSDVQLIENGFMVVQSGKIVKMGYIEELEDVKKKLKITKCQLIGLTNTQLLIPGLVDTHIHAVQYPNCGLGYDKTLLEWLECYTYKLEKSYKHNEFAARVLNAVVLKTLSHGTTTAAYFASLYDDVCLLLVDAAIKYGQRCFVGKCNMMSHSPDDYTETKEESISKTNEFVAKVLEKKSNIVKPIVTPRFALSCDMDLMQTLTKIAQTHDLNIQSHISENKDEVRIVTETYGKPYANVYDEAGMLSNKTILAHGIHLAEDEMELIASRGASIAHCPNSNFCLQSGHCDVQKLIAHGVTVGLGTDISGGASPSIVNAMRSALNVSISLSFSDQTCIPMNWKNVFYLATLGGAKALSLGDKIGNFEEGKEFDALVIDVDVPNSSCDYLIPLSPLENLQKFIYLGDDRNIINVYVEGKRVK